MHRLGALTVDEDTRGASWRGSPTSLSLKELDVLSVLAESPARVHTFAELTRRVWSREYLGDDDSVVSAVRAPAAPARARTDGVRVESVRGIGFRLVEDGAPTTSPAQSFSTGA